MLRPGKTVTLRTKIFVIGDAALYLAIDKPLNKSETGIDCVSTHT
jgi:hypothetical protein